MYALVHFAPPRLARRPEHLGRLVAGGCVAGGLMYAVVHFGPPRLARRHDAP